MDKKWSKVNLEKVVKESRSIKECLIKLGIPNYGDRYTYIKNKIKKYDIDNSHFLSSKENRSISIKKGKEINAKYPFEDIFCSNSKHSLTGTNLKSKLYSLGLKKEECELCGLKPNDWKIGKVGMILDHIDGVHSNNELSNLRIICPNCDSTLPTFKSRNIKKK